VGGFMDGTKIEFAPGLNCIIGARGTGKTTALEFIRFALDAMPDDRDACKRIEGLVSRNLDFGRVEVGIETKDGLTYVVTRSLNDAPMVLSDEGTPTGITLKAGGFFAADIFSQNEVESIADRSISQLELIDTFDPENIAELDVQIKHVGVELAGNANAIQPLHAKIATVKEELDALPSLIACQDWIMRAEIHRGRAHRRYFLDLKAGQLHADHDVEEFDSAFEGKFCAKWGAAPRSGWTIHREADVLHQGQTAFIPDFSFQHEDGRRVFLEIAAYWTPEYVQMKSAKIDLFPGAPLLLAMPQRHAKKWSELPPHVLLFKSALKINAVVEALERVLPVSAFHSQRDGSDKSVVTDSQGEQRGQLSATQNGIEQT